MPKWFLLVLFAISSADATWTAKANVKQAFPHRDLTNKAVVSGNQINGGERSFAEERGVETAVKKWSSLVLDQLKGIENAVQFLRQYARKRWKARLEKEIQRLIESNADDRTLFKNGVSVKTMIQAGKIKEAKRYEQFLLRRKSTVSKLLNSSEMNHWRAWWRYLQSIIARILVKTRAPEKMLYTFRVNVKTVQDNKAQVEAYKKFLSEKVEAVNRLMDHAM